MSLRRIVKEELSGTIAKSFVAEITRFHRIQASTMFHEAAEYVKNELIQMGLKDAVIERFRSDGAKKYWTYTSPIGWTVKSAELRLVEPEDRLIVSYEDLPQSLHTYSNGTTSIGVTAELIDVGTGTKPADYEGKDVKGKYVLATGRAKLVHEQAVFKFGAAGVLTDAITYEMPNVRESLDIPDAHAYQSIWPTAEELPKVTFGFSLSKRQGNHLRSMLKNGKKVRLKATVDASLFQSYLDVVTATIPGKSMTHEETFLIAHLCHPKPSANDNASGSGLLLEIARTIKTLIKLDKIEPPARTIRFIWVPETFGTIVYLHKHQDLPPRLVGGINLDMVGQDQELCRSTLNLDRTPDSLPSFLNDLVFNLMEDSTKEFDSALTFGSSSTFRYATGAFSGGSDHAEFTDSTIGVPCVMLLQWPDLYYHTSLDTIDKVSEDSLKRVGWITTMATLTLANATAETAFVLSSQTTIRGTARIMTTCQKAIQELQEKREDRKLGEKPEELAKELAQTARYYRDKIEHATWREQQAVISVRRLGQDKRLNAIIAKYVKDIQERGEAAISMLEETLAYIMRDLSLTPKANLPETKDEKASKKLIPQRLFKCTLDFSVLKRALGEKEFAWYQEIEEKDKEFSKKSAEVLNFIDGKRTVYDIVRAVSAEYSKTDPSYVLKFLRDLERTKLVSLR